MSVHSISSQKASVPSADFQDKEVQTVVKVYPFILASSVSRASVTADKKFCTVLSLETSTDNSKFYNLLQYCPYQDIEDHNVRVLNLPRKTKLQWVTHTQLSEQGLHKTTMADDDGVAEVCQDLLLRLRSGKKTTFADADTQTDLWVRPHLLEEPKVAVIYRTVSVQVMLHPKCRANP